MKKETPILQSDFFKNWCKDFLRYLDEQKNPDFPNRRHRKMWGIDED